jgi:hypothetical protein
MATGHVTVRTLCYDEIGGQHVEHRVTDLPYGK